LESNWRWNVAEQGLSHSDIRLLARVVGSAFLWVGGFTTASNGFFGTIETNPFSGQWGWNPLVLTTGDRFPFGVDVEPD